MCAKYPLKFVLSVSHWYPIIKLLSGRGNTEFTRDCQLLSHWRGADQLTWPVVSVFMNRFTPLTLASNPKPLSAARTIPDTEDIPKVFCAVSLTNAVDMESPSGVIFINLIYQ